MGSFRFGKANLLRIEGVKKWRAMIPNGCDDKIIILLGRGKS